MIDIIKADERHFNDFGWLKTYWLFSFGEYYDPNNVQFGRLRVFNDDVVAPGSGFPTHPHREMEIVTVVLEGEISHEDSMGNKGTIEAGEVQSMSAGTGLTHSEYNQSDKELHFYQVWFLPNVPGLKPSYRQRRFDSSQWHNRLCLLASARDEAEAVKINAEADLYRAGLEKNKTLCYKIENGRRVFIYITSGELQVNGIALQQNEQARIKEENVLNITAASDSEMVLISVG
jgi:redox-sensitive bicupin YhaK (pirin superfamily)